MVKVSRRLVATGGVGVRGPPRLGISIVNSRYLDFGYLELPLISKRKSGPCFNTETSNQVAKYCGKEEKLLLGSNFSPFPQYFQYIFLIKGVKLYSHL